MLDFARIAFVVAMLAGGASLSRLGDSFTDLSVLGEVRFIALTLLVPLAALIVLASDSRTRHPTTAGFWLAMVLLLHLWVGLSWGWSERTAFGGTQLYEIALLVSALSAALILFRDNPRRSTALVFGMSYGAAVLFTVASFLLTGRLQGEIAAFGAGGIGTARILGMGLVVGTFFALRTARMMWLLPAPFLVAGMLLTGSRAAVLALLPALLLLWWKRRAIADPRAKHRRRSTRLRQVVLVVIASGAFFAAPIGQDLLKNFVASILAGATREQSLDTELYLADRDVIFLDAWTRFAGEPLRGLGLGSYVGPYGELYPHNLLLGYAVDAGIAALLTSIGLLAYSLFIGWRGTDAFGLGALSAAVFYGVASLFAGTYYDARFVWLFLMLGLMLATRRSVDRAMIAGTLEFRSRSALLPAVRGPPRSDRLEGNE